MTKRLIVELEMEEFAENIGDEELIEEALSALSVLMSSTKYLSIVIDGGVKVEVVKDV